MISRVRALGEGKPYSFAFRRRIASINCQNRVIQLVDDTCIVKEPLAAYSTLFDTEKTSLSR